MIEMHHWTARRHNRYVTKASRYYKRVINLEVDNSNMIRTYSKAITSEFAALSGFASYMYRNCNKATTSIEDKKAFERRFYWFTRQAYRNPARFAKQVGPALSDYMKEINAVTSPELAEEFLGYYISRDL